MGSPPVVAVVLTWNEYENTAETLRSLQSQSYADLSVVLVDNGSTDGSFDRLESEFPGVTTIRRGSNDGFAAGVNDGIRTALEDDAAFVWLLNNDVVIPEGVLGALVDRFESEDGLGLVSPKVMQYPDTDAPWFTQGVIDRETGDKENGEEVVDPSRRSGALVYNDYVPFTCALVRAEVFDEVGLLPERYFIYGEDAEFGAMLSAAGYDLVTDTDVEMYHKENATTGGPLSPFFTYYEARNRWLFARQFEDVDWTAFVSDYVVWLLKVNVRSVVHRKPDNVVASVRGTVDGVLDEAGQGPY